MEILRGWQVRHAGLYTFAHSPKHMALYQKFGFWPRDLVANVVKPVGDVRPQMPPDTSRFNDVEISGRAALLAVCREVTNANFEGLDVSREIRAVAEQKLGNTILVWDGACARRVRRLPHGPAQRSRHRRLLREIRGGAPRAARGENLSACSMPSRRSRAAPGRTRSWRASTSRAARLINR